MSDHTVLAPGIQGLQDEEQSISTEPPEATDEDPTRS